MPTLKHVRLNIDADFSEKPDVSLKFLVRVPRVVRAAPNEHTNARPLRVSRQFRWDITAERDHAATWSGASHGRAKRHGCTLREANIDHTRERMLLPDLGDDAIHVRDVVGDRQLAILACHPARDNVVAP